MGRSPFARAGAAILLILAMLGPAAAQPQRVLLLHSFGPHFSPWGAIASRLREEIIQQSRTPIALYEASLQIGRFGEPHDEAPFVDYLRALFAGRSLDLVVAMGAPAAQFFLHHRPGLFPSTPLLITGADVRTLRDATLTANDTAVAVWFDQARLIDNILQLLPDTKTIVVATGASPIEKFWLENLQREYQPFAARANFEWLNQMSLEEMLEHVARLPPRSAIYYNHIHVDAHGVPQENERALSRFHQVAKAPIFSFIDSNFGHGIVGGPLVSTELIARQSAAVAIRILRGESAGDIKTPTLGLEPPVYDWRELRRWNIDEARLPPGSTVQFREATVWERYHWQLTAIFIASLAQMAIITWLLLERRGRRTAQLEARERFLEVMHLNRTAAAGALSASFAHELSQPLEAALLNTDTAERLIAANPPDLARAKEVLIDIRQANKHAAEVIRHLKKLLKRGTGPRVQGFDLNEAIADALQILSPEAIKRSITLRANGVQLPLPVKADRIHFQQVVLNLVTNGMDAMIDTAPEARAITIQAALAGDWQVEVSVSDSGTGVPRQKLIEIFDTFYTTKQEGTGLGLSIARTIVESYGGKIWAENRIEGGAVFRFTLPLFRPT